jgi:hypothetical protein
MIGTPRRGLERLVKFFGQLLMGSVEGTFLAQPSALFATLALGTADLLMAAVIEVLGEGPEQFGELQGGFV